MSCVIESLRNCAVHLTGVSNTEGAALNSAEPGWLCERLVYTQCTVHTAIPHVYLSRRLPRSQIHFYFPPTMTVDRPFEVYQEHLSSIYHGFALWNPNPVQELYDNGHVSIGDVGYLRDGGFIRMFNVTLP